MRPINRRKFIRKSITIGGITIGLSVIPNFVKAGFKNKESEIYSISSDNPKEAIPRLIESLGGIEKFVKVGDKVGFLVNSPWVHQGFYTNPDVVLVVMKMCKDAGAKEIICYKPVRDGYWEESQYYNEMKPLIDEIVYADERVVIDITGGKEMKSAEIFKLFMETDVFINIPVAKHHNGTTYSGILKNLMGVSSRETNRNMHSPDGEYTYSKTVYLSTCIADLNLIRLPDLSIIDAGVCAIDNGPRGPGDTISPGVILAGTDPLAMDVYASSLLNMDPVDIYTFTAAKTLGLGISDIEAIQVKSII